MLYQVGNPNITALQNKGRINDAMKMWMPINIIEMLNFQVILAFSKNAAMYSMWCSGNVGC